MLLHSFMPDSPKVILTWSSSRLCDSNSGRSPPNTLFVILSILSLFFYIPVANIIKICDRTKRIYRIRYFLNTLNDNVSSTIKVRFSLQKVRQFVTYVLQNMLLDTISKTIKKNKCKKIGCKINFLLNLRAIKVSYFSLMP